MLTEPLASALNYMPGVNNANEFTVPIGDNGDICIYTHAETDIVVDIYGYYIAGSGGTGEQGPAGQDGPTVPTAKTLCRLPGSSGLPKAAATSRHCPKLWPQSPTTTPPLRHM